MKISIITPIYNAEKYIRRCIESITNQSYTNYELILINDGSSDDSAEICEAYAKDNDKIKVIHQKNSGPGPSRNNGIRHATGNYILFVDSDDYIHNCTLKTLVEAAEENNHPDVILFDYIMGNQEYSIKRSTLPGAENGFVDTKNTILNSAGSTWCKMYKTTIITENSITFPALPRKEDFVFNKIALSFCNNVFYIKEHLYFYFNNVNSIMHTTNFSPENHIIAFDILDAQMSTKYKGCTKILKINNYLIGMLQYICENQNCISQIKIFITEFERDFSNWYEKSKELKISKEKKFLLCLLHKRQYSILKAFLMLRLKIKKYLLKKPRGRLWSKNFS